MNTEEELLVNLSEENPEPAPKILKRYREYKGDSLRELGKALGLHWSTISYWENGHKEAKLVNRRKVALYYGVPMEKLFAEDYGQELPM